MVAVPAPTHTHGVGQRGLPGHMGDVLGLVGFEGRRSLEQVVGGAATAVAREGGGGTAAVQAGKKEEIEGEMEPILGLCVGRTSSYQRSPAASLQVSLQKQVGLGKTASFSVFLVSSP